MKFNLFEQYAEGERVEGASQWGTVIDTGVKPVILWDDGTVTRGKRIRKQSNILMTITLWQEKLWQVTSNWF